VRITILVAAVICTNQFPNWNNKSVVKEGEMKRKELDRKMSGTGGSLPYAVRLEK
jgi:hypothetical protein